MECLQRQINHFKFRFKFRFYVNAQVNSHIFLNIEIPSDTGYLLIFFTLMFYYLPNSIKMTNLLSNLSFY